MSIVEFHFTSHTSQLKYPAVERKKVKFTGGCMTVCMSHWQKNLIGLLSKLNTNKITN